MLSFPLRWLTGALLTATALSAAAPTEPTQSAPFVVSAARAPDKPWNDFPTRIVSHLTDFKAQPPAELSQYGGRKSEKRTATGFFRTEKTPARWWLIDPEGYRYINVAVVDVHIPPGSTTVKNNLQKTFGSNAQWADAAITQMRDMASTEQVAGPTTTYSVRRKTRWSTRPFGIS
jgi:hypothetical protein